MFLSLTGRCFVIPDRFYLVVGPQLLKVGGPRTLLCKRLYTVRLRAFCLALFL